MSLQANESEFYDSQTIQSNFAVSGPTSLGKLNLHFVGILYVPVLRTKMLLHAV